VGGTRRAAPHASAAANPDDGASASAASETSGGMIHPL